MSPFAKTFPLLAMILGLAACGGPNFVSEGRELPTPDDPGMYALTLEDDLHQLDGPGDWERKTWPQRSNFQPDIEFIVFEPAIAADPRARGEVVQLTRVAWLRSEYEPSGLAAPVSGPQWVVTDLEDHRERLIVTPHPEIAGIVHLRPADGLSPGLYELSVNTGILQKRARVGILWNSVDKRAYSAENCVDRVLAGQFAFRPCATAAAGPTYEAASPPPSNPTSALVIALSDPIRENGGLTIRGTVTNTSAMVQTVPPLRGTLVDGSGNPADSWIFAVPESTVAPGGKVGFTTWRPAHPGAARLNVDFLNE